MKQFDVELEILGGNAIIKLMGELDANTCVVANQEFEMALASDVTRVLVDCNELSYVSSAGLGVFIAAYQACNQKGISLIFYAVQPKVVNVLSILGLERILTIKKSLEEALAVPATIRLQN